MSFRRTPPEGGSSHKQSLLGKWKRPQGGLRGGFTSVAAVLGGLFGDGGPAPARLLLRQRYLSWFQDSKLAEILVDNYMY